MNLNNISCIMCREQLKNFKNIIIHYIMHKYLCPFCLSEYRSYKQFYDGNGHFNTKKCKNEQNKIITNDQKRDRFYKKLMDITENNENDENNENNQTFDNEENHNTIGLVHSDDENNEIRMDQNEANINNEIRTDQNEANINNENNEIRMDQNEPIINNENILDILLNKKHFFERIDFDTDFETGIYTNYKSGLQFKNLKNKNKNKIVLLRIFTDSMQCQNKKDYTIMLDIENYTGNEFKNNKLLLFVVPNDWLHNFHQTIRALFSSFIGNGFKVIIENEQIDVVPFGLTMDIPEFRASCKLNGHNSNEYACHTCDKPRDGLFICQSGTLRKQEDITNFHSTKPTYAELNDDIKLKK
ncbi:hypothetical protein ACTFIR_002879, partial [Dictyostelium discoideum]